MTATHDERNIAQRFIHSRENRVFVIFVAGMMTGVSLTEPVTPLSWLTYAGLVLSALGFLYVTGGNDA